MLTEDDGILSALIEAANTATTEAFHLIYAERREDSPSDTDKPARKSPAGSEQAPAKKRRRSVKKPAAKKSIE